MVKQMSRVKGFFILQTQHPSLTLVFNRHWEEEPNYATNAYTQLSKSRTNIEVARKGFDGDIIGYKEILIEDPNLTSTNSTSFSRSFGSTKTFVRGSASQFPFAPGGLDAVDNLEDVVEELDVDIDFFDLEDLSVVAPGLERSLHFEGEEVKKETEAVKKDTIFNIEDMMAPDNTAYDFLNVKLAPVDEVAAEPKLEEKQSEGNRKK